MDFDRKNSVGIATVRTAYSAESNKSTKKDIPSKNLNFSYSLRPIYYFSRTFGLFPFTIVYDTNGDVQSARVTVFDFLWFIITVCMYLLLAWLSYGNKLPVGANESPLLILGDLVLLIIGLIFGSAMIVFDMYNRSRLINIIKKFTKFDMEVNVNTFCAFGIF